MSVRNLGMLYKPHADANKIQHNTAQSIVPYKNKLYELIV